MKNIQKILTMLIAIGVFSTILSAKERTLEEINNIAINYVKKDSGTTVSIDTSNGSKLPNDNKRPYQIIFLEPKGWVIVSKDDRLSPVYGYSLSSTADEEMIKSSAFVAMLKAIDDSIKKDSKEIQTKSKKHQNSTDKLSIDPDLYRANANYKKLDDSKVSNRKKFGPLMNPPIRWRQKAPYNKYSPLTPSGKKGVVGCVPLALGIATRYYKMPKVSPLTGKEYNWEDMNFDDIARHLREISQTTSSVFWDHGTSTDGYGVSRFIEKYKYTVTTQPSQTQKRNKIVHLKTV